MLVDGAAVLEESKNCFSDMAAIFMKLSYSVRGTGSVSVKLSYSVGTTSIMTDPASMMVTVGSVVSGSDCGKKWDANGS